MSKDSQVRKEGASRFSQGVPSPNEQQRLVVIEKNDNVEFMGSQSMSPVKSTHRARIPIEPTESMNTYESPRFYIDGSGVEKQNSAESSGFNAIYRKNFKDEEEEAEQYATTKLNAAKKAIISKLQAQENSNHFSGLSPTSAKEQTIVETHADESLCKSRSPKALKHLVFRLQLASLL